MPQRFVRLACLCFLLCCSLLEMQAASLRGQVRDQASQQPLPHARLRLVEAQKVTLSDAQGMYAFESLAPGTYTLEVQAQGFKSYRQRVLLRDQEEINVALAALSYELSEVLISDARSGSLTMGHLREVEDVGIYAAKKTELINIEQLTANLATNNARQVYARVAGLNIWESDGAGLQLGIGGRGLSPNRTANFNTRQNGYDMSADALGYPESYYTPPVEALERIEIIRGAASLQFGPQFGGVLNFQLKQGPEDKKLQWTSRQTLGSFGFYGGFNSLGGTLGKVNYYAFHQYKTGNGWRPNSSFDSHTAYASARWQATNRLRLGLEYTHMSYLAQQAGGLTDAEFEQTPRASFRARNWFQVQWNLAAIHLDYQLQARTRFNLRTFGLLASRKALGYLGPTNSSDPINNEQAPEYTQYRDLLWGNFRNAGSEARLLHGYDLGSLPQSLLVGARYYQGNNESRQGDADAGYEADFRFLNPERLERSAYTYPSRNASLFAEHIFRLLPQWSITPGIRYEYIQTTADGYYRTILRDLADNVFFDSTYYETRERTRSQLLLGIGISYKAPVGMEVYANFSQNYRAINFTDFRSVNPSFRIDPELKDERGYNLDLGLRGSWKNTLRYDISAFYLAYRDRIGAVQAVDSTLFSVYRFRTNVADSRTYGLESLLELDLTPWLFAQDRHQQSLSLFSNLALIRARYLRAHSSAIEGKQVEMVPTLNLKLGVQYAFRGIKASLQHTYVSEHFTDATNALRTSSAVVGIIPAYSVMDLSLSYGWKAFTLEGSINNLLDARYFTRRATGYPGPGIIPSDARSFFLTLQVQL